jgi:cell division protein FtsB
MWKKIEIILGFCISHWKTYEIDFRQLDRSEKDNDSLLERIDELENQVSKLQPGKIISESTYSPYLT